MQDILHNPHYRLIKVQLGYHQNPSDNIDFGDLVVTADTGLAITGVSITD